MEDTYSNVQHNGHLSKWFPTNCGIRQGCPFSPLCFIMAVEILAIKIRQTTAVKGIILPNHEEESILKLAQYADDGYLFVNDMNDVKEVCQILDNFSNISGLRLNYDKCKGMWLGPQSTTMPAVIEWCTDEETLKVLGVHFSSTTPAAQLNVNWEPWLS